MNNVTGWNELMNGSLVQASYAVVNEATFGWFSTIFLVLYMALLFYKTKSPAAIFAGGVLFVGLHYAFLKSISVPIIIIIMVFSLAAVIFSYFKK